MIPKEFKDTIQHYGEYESIVLKKPNGVFITNGELFDEKKPKDEWYNELSEIFEREYRFLSNKNIYFIGCGFECYLEHYPKRLGKYLNEYNEALEIDFLLNEYNLISSNEIFEFASEKLKEEIKISYRKQKEFLEDKILELGYEFFKSTSDNINQKYDYRKIKTISTSKPPLDLSETSMSEKIIYLELLGIIDFIKAKPKMGISNNGLASVLSAITGGKTETIQSYINPINNPMVSQKNNPLNKEKNVLKVKKILIELGIKPK